MYIQKESVRCILIKIKGFSNVKGFQNEHGYISYFKFIFCFYKFNKVGHIQSFPTIWFNICFFLIHGTTNIQVKNKIYLLTGSTCMYGLLLVYRGQNLPIVFHVYE